MADLIKLNLGAGSDKKDGYIGVDVIPGNDVTLDLEQDAWPWAEASVDEILAQHVVEHLQSLPKFMNRCHLILKSGGLLKIATPHPLCAFFWQDPTHVRGYTANTFLYYCTGQAGTEHAGILPYRRVEVNEFVVSMNGVECRVIEAQLNK